MFGHGSSLTVNIILMRKSNLFIRDTERECLKVTDDLGHVEFSLADLPGKVLTELMLVGLVTFLYKSPMPRTTWLSLRKGLFPTDLRCKAKKKPKVLGALAPLRRAIVSTMLGYEGCRLSPEEAEAMVRAMNPTEVRLWGDEPDVKLAYRELTGKSSLRLRELVEGLQAAA
jgi:hypothetical protein